MNKQKKDKCIKCNIKYIKIYSIHPGFCINCIKTRNIILPINIENINKEYKYINKRKELFNDKNIINCFNLKTYIFFIDKYLLNNNKEYKRIEEIIEDIYGTRVEFIYEYSMNITHHIVFDENRLCFLSFEYLLSLISGKFILSIDFLKKMIEIIPNEKEFLIKGDFNIPLSMAPYKCLNGLQFEFFNRLNIICPKKIFKGKVLDLILKSGATFNIKSEKKYRLLNRNVEFKNRFNKNVKNTKELLEFFANWNW